MQACISTPLIVVRLILAFLGRRLSAIKQAVHNLQELRNLHSVWCVRLEIETETDILQAETWVHNGAAKVCSMTVDLFCLRFLPLLGPSFEAPSCVLRVVPLVDSLNNTLHQPASTCRSEPQHAANGT